VLAVNFSPASAVAVPPAVTETGCVGEVVNCQYTSGAKDTVYDPAGSPSNR
jgi:hypothetical protein